MRPADHVLIACRMLALLAALPLAVAAGHAAEAQGPPAVLVLSCDDRAGMQEVVGDIERAGGIVRHRFPPHVLIAECSDAVVRRFRADPRVDLFSRDWVDPESVPADYGRAARDAVRVWNDVYVSPPSWLAAPLDAIMGLPLIDDAAHPPIPPVRAAADEAAPGAPPGAAFWQTSEYLMGSTTVSLVLPESDGSIDANLENWTSTERSNVQAECVAGLNWWASHYPYSVATLSFTWIFNYDVATSYEPITRPMLAEGGLWIAEALTALGYPGTQYEVFQSARAYGNDLRDDNGTDWAFIVFVVDSSNDADDRFPDDRFAYAYFGGPYAVMTYGNDGWDIDDMDSVLAHEAGHIYRAEDEYCLPDYYCCSPSVTAGYLNVLNSNCQQDPPCIMNLYTPDTCSVTKEQLGWRDTDGDGVPDILDVPPSTTLDEYSPDPTDDQTPTFTGSASVGYYPNQLYPGEDVTLNRIADVQFRVDGGPWQSGAAADGEFDEDVEPYTFTPPVLPGGEHTFEARAVDTTGNSTPAPYPSDTLFILGHAFTVTGTAEAALIPSGGSVALAASAADEEGHGVATWAWDDGGAGGAFSPSAADQNPTYTTPVNTSGSDLSVLLTVTATCDGSPGMIMSDSISLTVTYDYDGDGMADFWEQANGFDPTNGADAVLDPDGDGLSNRGEFLAGTDPGNADTDGDTLPDGWELTYGLDPTTADDPDADTDNDGLSAYEECQFGADPADRDSDGDGFGDGEEVSLDSDPTDGGDTPASGSFSDVAPTGHGDGGLDPYWAFHEIEACFRAGIAGGYLDGTYHPDWAVNRGQMAVYIARALAGGDAGVPEGPASPSFPDVPDGHWAYKYVEYAVSRNIVAGYFEGDYRPDVELDRGQMAVFIARSIVDPTGEEGLADYHRPVVPTFLDVPTQFWAYTHIEYCAEQGVVQGYPDGSYLPDIIVGRDQMAVYITRAFDLPM